MYLSYLADFGHIRTMDTFLRQFKSLSLHDFVFTWHLIIEKILSTSFKKQKNIFIKI